MVYTELLNAMQMQNVAYLIIVCHYLYQRRKIVDLIVAWKLSMAILYLIVNLISVTGRG